MQPSHRSAVLVLREYITRAAQRDDSPRMLRVVLDGRAQARDVYVDGAVEVLECLTLGEIHQRFTREHAAGAFRQCQQQRELVAGQRLALAIEPHFARALVDLEPAELQHLGLALPDTPAQDGAQSRQQLAWLERLGQ